MMKQQVQSADGFTLVDMLVALSIFSVIALAGAAILDFSLDAQDINGRHHDQAAELVLARALIRNDMAQITPAEVDNIGGTQFDAVLVGGETAVRPLLLSFSHKAQPNPLYESPLSHVQHVEYRFEEGSLIRRSKQILNGREEGAWQSQTLLSDLEDVVLQFQSNGAWSNRWFAQSGELEDLPDVISFELSSAYWGNIRLLALTSAGSAQS